VRRYCRFSVNVVEAVPLYATPRFVPMTLQFSVPEMLLPLTVAKPPVMVSVPVTPFEPVQVQLPPANVIVFPDVVP
jgi:hypothetical protein